MANVRKTIELDVVMNNNEKSDQYGKYYGRVHAVEALNLRGLVDHIMSHGTPYTRDMVTGIVIRLRDWARSSTDSPARHSSASASWRRSTW